MAFLLGRAVVAAGLLVTLVTPAGVRASDVTFGRPEVETAWNESITFTVDVDTATPLARAELRLEFPGAIGPYVVDVPVTGGATQALEYELDLTGGGHLVPNTPITATWAAYTKAGGEPVLSEPRTIRYRDTSHEWRTLEGDLVNVHWYAGGESFARDALRIGDQAVRETADLLGVTETEPVDFFIYGDDVSFRAALGPGTRENVGGQAHADIRTLFALIEPEAIDNPWVGIVIPHELVHLVFDTAVSNPYRFPPRWLNEGLAVYLSEGYGSADRNRVADAVERRDLLPLDALTGQFPTEPEKTSLAYAEAVSAVDHLVRTEGQDALITLVLAYRDGLTDDEAFTKAIGKDVAAFQAGWLAELGAEEPERFGPRPAPAGPLPPGWSGPAPTSAPEASPASPTSEPTAGPTTTPDAEVDDGSGGLGSSPVLVAGGFGLVVLVVMAGLALARRRGAAE